ncbi:Cullin binding-domain-containing protein [Cryomyces antarcticus]
MPPAYTASQKAAIAQFVSFTQVDKASAARSLKTHNWNVDAAVNGFYSNGQNTAHATTRDSSLNQIFDKYQDAPKESPNKIGPTGTMKFFGDIGVDLEGISMLIASEIVQSPSMGEMEREGFVKGWTALGADTTAKMKAATAARQKEIASPTPTGQDAFKRVYRHTFAVGREPGQKAVSLSSATEFWRVLFGPSGTPWASATTPWLDWWIDFLEQHHRKSVNKDLWNQTLNFALKCLADESVDWWDEESAWPGVVDEFVEFVKSEKRGATDGAMEIE